MVTLVKDVVGLESDAESIVQQAHAEVKLLEKSVEEEITSYRRKLTEETHQRIAEFQKNTEETYRNALTDAEEELKAVLDALDRIPYDNLQKQVEMIVSRCREL
jgi:F0F1-type ATP synthase membrane subunit b/b'